MVEGLVNAGTGPSDLRFSVVVPTFQRRGVVVGAVRALAAQENAPPFEVVVVVDGSTDGSAAALRELETPFELVVLEQENRGRAAACNAGAGAARGDFLLLLDDDMEAHPRLLAEHERSHREGADVVLGDIPLHPESPPGFLSAAVGEWAEGRARRLREQAEDLGLHDFLTGQMSMRRDVFVRLGGFDTRFTRRGSFGNEDLDLGHRLAEAGRRIVFNPDAVSWQRFVVTPRQYLRQWRQAGRADVVFARKHPDQSATIFLPHRLERRADRLLWRWLRRPLRAAVLALAAAGPQGPRTTRWFYRVRNLEYQRGIREAGGIPAANPVRVLCYHAIADLVGAPILEPYGIPPHRFRRQLQLIQRYFNVLEPDEFGRFLRGEGGVPERALLLTFDDCYEDLLAAGLPLLREADVPALAFAVTGRLGGTNDWDAPIGAPQLRLLDGDGLHALAEGGVTIGSHSRSHRMLNRIPGEDLSDEIGGSAEDLERLGFGRPAFLAFPHGEHSEDVRRATAAAGFAAAFTVEPGLVRPGHDPYSLPRLEILRIHAGWRFLPRIVVAGRWKGFLASPGAGIARARRA